MGMICASSSGNFTSSVNAVLVGKNIRCLRKKAGLTAARLGELVYVSPQAVCKWERGQSMPSIDVLVLLRNVFHISIDSILVLEQDQDAIFSVYIIKPTVDRQIDKRIVIYKCT